ncbi:hypothetical protein [Stygiolobus caldivivus]|uniref:Uncharacterized protein n=1 Tax=Stygiolobus caldivivus TaxID=2824673 RepID=A0A8D5ZEI1_9CREN|nr:hypothetical protein [Stygiolobus caldivivus]BCU69688.1 hypothetical protein KN1_09850 [Stygiolobus caldivivus]
MLALEELYEILNGKKMVYIYSNFANEGMYSAFIGLMDKIREGNCSSSLLSEYIIVTCPKKGSSYVIGVDNNKAFVLRSHAILSLNSSEEAIRQTLGFDKHIWELNYSLPNNFKNLRVRVQGEVIFDYIAFNNEEQLKTDLEKEIKKRIEKTALEKLGRILEEMLDLNVEVNDNTTITITSPSEEDIKDLESLLGNSIAHIKEAGNWKVLIFKDPFITLNEETVSEVVRNSVRPEGLEVRYGEHQIYLVNLFPPNTEIKMKVVVGTIPVKVKFPLLTIADIVPRDPFEIPFRNIPSNRNGYRYYLISSQKVKINHPEHGEVEISIDKPIKLAIREINAERELDYVSIDEDAPRRRTRRTAL